MPDVFVSYSRRDTEFVRSLAQSLQDDGREVWVDVDGIRDAEVFPNALRSAIEASNAFVFVISPDSVDSEYCANEVEHAVENNKQIIPLLHRRVPDEQVPEPIRVRNWIPFDEFPAGVARLKRALDTDLEWTKQHTRWLLKALEWDKHGRDRSFLLRGTELQAAERWLAADTGKDPRPSQLQRDYLLASRAAATRRLRLLVGAMGVALAVSIVLGVVALTQRNAAEDNRRQAEAQRSGAQSRELAALSENQRQFDPELAILLGIEAVERAPTTQAMVALRGAIDASALRMTLRGHVEHVSSASFSRDGTLIATSTGSEPPPLPGAPPPRARPDRHKIRIWNAETGKLSRIVSTGGPPTTTAFSPDGQTLVVAEERAGIGVYDLGSGREQTRLARGERMTDVALSSDGRRAVAAGERGATLWDLSRRRMVRRLHTTTPAHVVALSADGRHLAAGTDAGLVVWDAASGRRLARVDRRLVTAVAFHPRNAQVAFGGDDRSVRLFDVESERVVKTYDRFPLAYVDAVGFSRDGRRVAAGTTDGVARVWNVRTGELVDRFEGHACCVGHVAFSPDGERLITTSKDETAKVWQTAANVIAETDVGDGAPGAVGYASDGRIVSATERGDAIVWNPAANASSRPSELRGGVRDFALSGDGRVAAIATAESVRLLSTSDGSTLHELRPRAVPDAVALDRRGRTLAIGTERGTDLHDARTGRRLRGVAGLVGLVTELAFSPDDRILAVASIVPPQAGRVAFVDWRADRVEGSVSAINPVNQIAFAPNGAVLAGATEADTTVKLWDVRSRRLLRQLFGHVEEPTGVAFGPDGSLVVTSSLDGSIRIWDPRDGTELRAIEYGRPVWSVAFSPDGNRIASGDGRGVLRVWDACTACRDPERLLALARRRVTRPLTAIERQAFLNG